MRDNRCRHEVGDIIAHVSTPNDYEYLIACNGQNFDKSKYPWLAEIFADGKLPNLNDNRFLEGSTTARTSKEAGLPDITGTLQVDLYGNNNGKGTGAFQFTGSLPGGDGGSGDGMGAYDFQASRCSSVYGKSDTVQPKSYTVTYYVCYA